MKFFVGVRNAIIISLIFYALIAVAIADPDDECSGNPHHCNGGGGDVVDVSTDVDVSTSTSTDINHSSKALALGNSLGDVDINDCRESVQFGTPLYSKQNVRLNPWCAAEVYDAKGLHKMAAVMRCDIKDIRKHFSSDEECLQANTVQKPAPIVVMAPPPREKEEDDEVKAKHDDLETRLALIEKKRAEDARRAARWAEEQKQVRQEQRNLAQQSLEALAEYRTPE